MNKVVQVLEPVLARAMPWDEIPLLFDLLKECPGVWAKKATSSYTPIVKKRKRED
jgi:hypothetical protein